MKLILSILPLFLLAESFISNLEYGEMLYNNPRGISCAKCHGKNGKGKLIATYINDKTGKVEKLIAPDITKINYEIFYNKVKNSKVLKKGKFKILNYSAMPKYDYLMNDEIKSIYNYLHKGNK
jgi:mono/diheme cytochrome c family protein